MKAFVTGGTGFIGSHLVDTLLDDPGVRKVRCLVRDRAKWLEGKAVEMVRGDLFDLAALTRGMEGADVVFHNAATLQARDQARFDQVNVQATESIVRIAARSGVKRLVVLSSLAAAGPSGSTPRTEEDPAEPITAYGRSKLLMERRIREIAPAGLQVNILRPPAVYGPREEQIFSYFKIAKYRLSPMLGRPETGISMVHVRDLVQGIRLAGEFGEGGVDTFFLSGPEVVSWPRIHKATDSAFGRRSLPLWIGPGTVRNLAGLVERTSGMFGAYPVFNREKARELVQQWTCDHEKAVRVLGYRPRIGLEEGIRDTIDWYRRHYWL